MQASLGSIVFIDNSVNRLFKSFDAIRNFSFDLKIFNDEGEGLEYIHSSPPDILFLNLDLVPHDAVSLTKELRRSKLTPGPYVVIYSDKQDDFVQEMALNSGADAFINFHEKPSILILFIKNLIRRRKRQVPAKPNEGVVVDTERFLIFKKNEPVQLPKKEFKVFELLYNCPGKFFSKEEIAGLIWGDEKIGAKRTIDVHIYNIRQLLGKRVIISQKGKGYKINSKYLSPQVS
jgi:DNA-binding response OmpR family regulator